MADGTAQYAEKVGDTQQSGSYGDEGVLHILQNSRTRATRLDGLVSVGYHLAFQHNERFHLPYMAVAEISL